MLRTGWSYRQALGAATKRGGGSSRCRLPGGLFFRGTSLDTIPGTPVGSTEATLGVLAMEPLRQEHRPRPSAVLSSVPPPQHASLAPWRASACQRTVPAAPSAVLSHN